MWRTAWNRTSKRVVRSANASVPLAATLRADYAEAVRAVEVERTPVKDYAERARISASNAGVRCSEREKRFVTRSLGAAGRVPTTAVWTAPAHRVLRLRALTPIDERSRRAMSERVRMSRPSVRTIRPPAQIGRESAMLVLGILLAGALGTQVVAPFMGGASGTPLASACSGSEPSASC
jgi:hypothetical protein